jgi:hypothetical protein
VITATSAVLARGDEDESDAERHDGTQDRHPRAGQEPRGLLGDGLRSFRHKSRLQGGLD